MPLPLTLKCLTIHLIRPGTTISSLYETPVYQIPMDTARCGHYLSDLWLRTGSSR